MQLPSDAEQCLAIEAIKQLKARYFRLMDTQQWSAFADVFTEDVVVDVSEDAMAAGEAIQGRDNVVAFIEGAVGRAKTVHHGHMPEITLLSATTARGIWAMFDHVEFKTKNGEVRGIKGSGHYHETYRKVGDTWHIATLKLTRLRVDPLG